MLLVDINDYLIKEIANGNGKSQAKELQQQLNNLIRELTNNKKQKDVRG